jgi:YegS/Rv2252/BmrU family lipid kinase
MTWSVGVGDMSEVNSAKIIVNAHSGFSNKEEVRGRLMEIFALSGVKADISIAQDGAQIAELARKAARGDWSVIVAAGGDGTVNAVASAVVRSEKTLAILPLGTLNHFARDLGIPFDLDAAAHILISGKTVNVDVGEVNGHIFVNNSSLGLYPTIVLERERRQRLGFGKWPAFVWAAIAALRRYPFLDVRLRAGEKHFHVKTPFVFVGNNEYVMERFNIGVRERLDRGLLSVYITNRTSRLGLVKLAVRALVGRLRNDKDFLALSTDEVQIQTRHRRVRVAFDGEVSVIKPPLHYRVRHRALRVLVPGEN